MEFRNHATGKKGGSQVFITTHQPYFVDALLPEEVWVLEKEEIGFSTIRRACDDATVKNMVAEGLPLGGLWYSDYLVKREIAKPIIRWEDSPQLGYEIFEKCTPRQGLPLFLRQLVPEMMAEQAASDGSLILAQAVRELAAVVPWGHHVLLLGRIKSPSELFYYLRATAQFGSIPVNECDSLTIMMKVNGC